MSKNPQVEEAKRWILEQRIYERHGNMLYVFPMLSSGDPTAFAAAALAKAREQDSSEKYTLSTQAIPLEGNLGTLDATVSARDAEELGRYGCIVLRHQKGRVVARIPTWVIRYPDSYGIVPALYRGLAPNSLILNTINEVGRKISEQRASEGDIEGPLTEGYQLLGVKPDRINQIIRAEDLTTRRYLKDARLLKLWEQEGRCTICRARLEIDEVTYEHWLPRNSGGLNNWGNMRVAHPSCNSDKGDILPPGLDADHPSLPFNKWSEGGIWLPGES